MTLRLRSLAMPDVALRGSRLRMHSFVKAQTCVTERAAANVARLSVRAADRKAAVSASSIGLLAARVSKRIS